MVQPKLMEWGLAPRFDKCVIVNVAPIMWHRHARSDLQKSLKVPPEDRVLLIIREGKAPNTFDGHAKGVAGVWCVGSHDDLLRTEVFNRFEDPLR